VRREYGAGRELDHVPVDGVRIGQDAAEEHDDPEHAQPQREEHEKRTAEERIQVLRRPAVAHRSWWGRTGKNCPPGIDRNSAGQEGPKASDFHRSGRNTFADAVELSPTSVIASQADHAAAGPSPA
jgi:hypothetical protein